MRLASLSFAAALLLLLGAAAATAPARPSFSEVVRPHLKKLGAGTAKDSIAIASVSQARDEYYKEPPIQMEEKEVCLLESDRRVCDDDGYHYFFTSDLTCCNKHDEMSNTPGGINTQLRAQQSVGSCDWTVTYDTTYMDITYNIYKIGKADAICYFGTDANECGGPFCEKMVITLYGVAFFADYAYSYWGEAETDLNCDYVYPRLARGQKDGANGAATNGTGVDAATGPSRERVHNRERVHHSDQAGDAAANARPRHSRRDARKRKQAAKAGPKAGAAYHKYDINVPDNSKVVAGEATIITGVVTSFTGPMAEKWESGSFEYVPYFYLYDTTDIVAEDGIDSSYPWIRDKAYKFTFFRPVTPY